MVKIEIGAELLFQDGRSRELACSFFQIQRPTFEFSKPCENVIPIRSELQFAAFGISDRLSTSTPSHSYSTCRSTLSKHIQDGRQSSRSGRQGKGSSAHVEELVRSFNVANLSIAGDLWKGNDIGGECCPYLHRRSKDGSTATGALIVLAA